MVKDKRLVLPFPDTRNPECKSQPAFGEFRVRWRFIFPLQAAVRHGTDGTAKYSYIIQICARKSSVFAWAAYSAGGIDPGAASQASDVTNLSYIAPPC